MTRRNAGTAVLWRRRSVVGAASVVVLAALLVGCGSSGAPEWWPADKGRELPEVEWPFGAPDVSDEWVAALFDANVALAVAQNVHDFTGEAVAEHVSAEFAAAEARVAAGTASHPGAGYSIYAYRPGPEPMMVTDVDDRGDRATVTGCSESWWGGHDGPGTTIGRVRADSRGRVVIYDLRRDADGQIRVHGAQAPSGGCDLRDLRPGYFVPEPPYGVPVYVSEVLGPDGEPALGPEYW